MTQAVVCNTIIKTQRIFSAILTSDAGLWVILKQFSMTI